MIYTMTSSHKGNGFVVVAFPVRDFPFHLRGFLIIFLFVFLTGHHAPSLDPAAYYYHNKNSLCDFFFSTVVVCVCVRVQAITSF